MKRTRGNQVVYMGQAQKKARGTRSNPIVIRDGRRTVTKVVLQKDSGELKGMDTLLTNAAIVNTTSTNDDIQCLNLIETGNGSWNRSGRKAYLKSIRLKGLATYTLETAATTYDLPYAALRGLLVWDKQPSGGTIPTFQTICGYTGQDGSEASTTWSGLRYDNTGRFSILKEIMMDAKPVAPSDGAAQASLTTNYPFDVFVDLKNRTSIYSGDSDPVTIADISSGALYLIWRQSTNSGVWAISSVSTARLRFTC